MSSVPPHRFPAFPLVLLVAIASAEAAATDRPGRLTLEEAEALALERSPAVRLAETEVERAVGARRGVEPLFPQNPVVGVDLGPRKQADVRGIQPSYQVRVEQAVDLFGQRSARLGAADEVIRLAEQRLDAARVEVRVRVRSAYLGALVASRRLDFVEGRVSNARRVREVAQARVAGGAAGEVEERLADAELGKAEADMLAARSAFSEARTQLATVLDIGAPETVALETPLGPPTPRIVSPDDLVNVALARRRDLLVLRQERRTVDAELNRLRAERLPGVSFVLNVQQDSRDQYWVGPGIAVAAPVWRRNQGLIAQAEAERRRVGIALETSERATERDLRRALEAVNLRRAEFELLERSVLEAVQRSRALILEGWQAGKFDIFRLLAVDLELVRAQAAYLEAISALWDAELTVERILGIGEGEET